MPRRRHPSHPPPPPRHHPRSASSSTIAAILQPDQLSALLAPFVPDPADRTFVVRCIAAEGPVHHRGASAALLRLLGLALEAAGGAPPAGGAEGEGAPVPLRLPPHLAVGATEDTHYPLRMPTAALERLAPAGSPEMAALIDCLVDGPPHHALANAAMVCLLGALLARLEARG